MVIISNSIFRQFPDIIFGFSTKKGRNNKPPYFFNLSLSVGDDEATVIENRRTFFNVLGLSNDSITYQKQIHSNIVTYVDSPGITGESDAMITDKSNLGLAISIADCTPIFIYDIKNKVIAAVHSGWRGTEQKIIEKTLHKLQNDFNSQPENLFVYIGPGISQKFYEVDKEVAELFDSKYIIPQNNKFLLDVKSANFDMLKNFAIPLKNIQVSNLCTFEQKKLLHSYRRDGVHSGRSLGVIAIKG